jgi:hypothetical protein
MSDFVAKLRARTRPEICNCAIGIHLADGSEPDEDCVKAADTITRLTSENEKLKAGLRECEAELNAYYRMEYPGSHPYSQKELAKAMASNPATVALKETSND